MVSKDNTRTLITLPKELKAKLEQQAKKESRSFSNLVLSVLKDYVEKLEG